MNDEKKPTREAQEKKPSQAYVPPGNCDFCREGMFLACFQRCPNCGRYGEYYGG